MPGHANQLYNQLVRGDVPFAAATITALTATTGTIATLGSTTGTFTDLVSGSLTLGTGGTSVDKIKIYTSTIDVASVSAATSAEQTFTVTGLAAGDVILSVNAPAATAGVGIVGMRVTEADTIGLTFMNATDSPVDPASGSYLIVALTPTA